MKSLIASTIHVPRTLYRASTMMHRIMFRMPNSILRRTYSDVPKLPPSSNFEASDLSDDVIEKVDYHLEEVTNDEHNNGIRKENIKMFTVEANKLADRIRSRQYQLQCIGGDATNRKHMYPQSMIFVNIGVDDKGIVNWSYMASDLDAQLMMNNVTVAFEGVGKQGFVRPGSAVVRYHLQWRAGGAEGAGDNDKAASNKDETVILALICCITVVIVCYILVGKESQYESIIHGRSEEQVPTFTVEYKRNSTPLTQSVPVAPQYMELPPAQYVLPVQQHVSQPQIQYIPATVQPASPPVSTVAPIPAPQVHIRYTPQTVQPKEPKEPKQSASRQITPAIGVAKTTSDE